MLVGKDKQMFYILIFVKQNIPINQILQYVKTNQLWKIIKN